VQPYLPISFATLRDLKFSGQESSAQLGDTIILSGHHLVFDENPPVNTSVKLVFKHKLFAVAKEIIPGQATANEIQFLLSNQPTDLPAGAYTVYASITNNLNPKQQVSNELPFLLAPKIDTPLASVVKVGNETTITITVTPELWPEQKAFLLLGSLQIPAKPRSDKTDTLTFIIQSAPKGTFFIRLRVDGIDSHLIQLVNDRLQFNPALQVTIP
jgi:hypothetical protein